ncbi:sulfurtransferase TusA family protein [Calidifontibacillus oryziterrae]|uniref:sulfurtransferase TusA family protein n=1 Tax=Calidifontibacillus oryziterrae TaxID=1191699 RepID=UPI0002DE2529|nr:sulfurtransferase TusA family protein [Calidifontibacillus oryziterrae]
MSTIKANVILDAKGLACPMPIVKTRKAMNDLDGGLVLEIQATDKGSKTDIKAWAESTGHQYLGTLEDGDVLKHFIRKSANDDHIEKTHPNVVNNQELEAKLNDENIMVVDVREYAEYGFNHIPNSLSIPLGELEIRMSELDKNKEIYVICRTGNRSDLAARKLAENGFQNVYNVIPGMTEWTGKTTSLNF